MGSMTEQKTCEERIGAQLAGRLSDFRAFNALIQDDEIAPDYEKWADEMSIEGEDVSDQARERQYEYPLDVEVERVVTVLLSTGGPHDEFRVTVDDDGEPVRIEYVFKDWFDGASRYLSGDEFEVAAEFLRPFVESALLS